MFNEKEYQRQYRLKNAEKRRAYSRQYHQLHKNDPEYIKKRHDYYWRTHTPRTLLSLEQKQTNARLSKQKWKKNNPDKVLQSYLKYRKEHDFYERWALLFWSKTIRKRDKVCQICGDVATVAHHLLFKSKYPELMFNLNNGIALCKQHHKEIHWGLK